MLYIMMTVAFFFFSSIFLSRPLLPQAGQPVCLMSVSHVNSDSRSHMYKLLCSRRTGIMPAVPERKPQRNATRGGFFSPRCRYLWKSQCLSAFISTIFKLFLSLPLAHTHGEHTLSASCTCPSRVVVFSLLFFSSTTRADRSCVSVSLYVWRAKVKRIGHDMLQRARMWEQEDDTLRRRFPPL